MRNRKKLWLENYETFMETRDGSDLCVNHLNQIIHMHGFTKLYHLPKDFMANTVSTIDLLAPFRSTLELKNRASSLSCAFLKSEEVTEDLSNLEWQECSVQSVETIGVSEGKDRLIQGQQMKCSCSADGEDVRKQKTRKRRKLNNMETGIAVLGHASGSASTSTPSSSVLPLAFC